ncbi:MAG: hypothetical protein LBI04_11995 [Treponema sp.]|jgi:hypothetical protein|nr:hypothetical protein [Treponema sp.]
MKLFNLRLLALLVSVQLGCLQLICCGDFAPSTYAVVLPDVPEAWVSLLGEPHWRLEWLDKSGSRRTADILPGKSTEIGIPVTWANPVTAWPYWPGHNLSAGIFKPAGALFPFDVDGVRLCLSWKAGVDAVFYRELALADSRNDLKIPANFDWLRFRELFNNETLSEAVRKDPWLVDWRSVAGKTISANFDRRRLVPEAAESVNIPVSPGPWYGISPFSAPLSFEEDGAVFPVRPGFNVWISPDGILRCSGKTWTFSQ